MVLSIVVGFQLFAAKRYCEQLRPGTAVWGYEDIALVAFGPIGKVGLCVGGYVITGKMYVCM